MRKGKDNDFRMVIKMTNEDLKKAVIGLLQKNARIGESEIADRLRSDPETVARLIREMEGDGTIIGYHALVNDELAGNGEVRALIEVQVLPERDGGFDRVARAIGRFREVRSVYLVSGQYDLRVEVTGETLQQVALFVASRLAPIDGVQATATHFMLKKYKESGFSVEKDEDYERLKVSP